MPPYNKTTKAENEFYRNINAGERQIETKKKLSRRSVKRGETLKKKPYSV